MLMSVEVGIDVVPMLAVPTLLEATVALAIPDMQEMDDIAMVLLATA